MRSGSLLHRVLCLVECVQYFVCVHFPPGASKEDRGWYLIFQLVDKKPNLPLALFRKVESNGRRFVAKAGISGQLALSFVVVKVEFLGRNDWIWHCSPCPDWDVQEMGLHGARYFYKLLGK